MLQRRLLTLLLTFSAWSATAQPLQSTVLNGEFGVALGAAHYFGDLNTNASLRRPKLAASFLFRKQFGNYIALRLQGTFAQLGFSDVYSKNETERLRNLSFNSNVFELAVMGDFNFFRFIPGERDFRFTPYVTLGAGFFTYDPYAFLNNEKYFLRPLGTEGQGSSLYPDRQPYSSMAFVIPFGVGIKYNLTPRTNLTFEITHRFTGTDYLDDVSTTYAGSPSPAFLLQDRSYELTNRPVGIAGRQRGNSSQKDQYITAMIGITFNLTSYRCPTAY
ncbi:MAG: DUF6089 family protein [Chitinophagaceae bacterium]|nr:DUF6089 family protein [Chitinophagaceae bacterium]